MLKELFLQADPQLTYSVNTQLKEQLKWLIGIGRIAPGDMLPPAGQLADQLGLNRNTVNLVYTQLRDEGIVTIQKGKGTRVADNIKVKELKSAREPMYELWMKTVSEAAEKHFNLEEFATAGMAIVQLLQNKPTVRPAILLVECREHDHTFYRQEVARLTGAAVKTFYLEEFSKAKDQFETLLNQADAVVATLNHFEEVNRIVGERKKTITIGATADFSLLMDIAKLSPGSKVDFVCLGQKGGQWMAQRVKDAGIQHIESSAFGTDQQEQLRKFANKADRLYASSAVYDEIKILAPDKAVHYPFVLEKSSELMLKNYAKQMYNH